VSQVLSYILTFVIIVSFVSGVIIASKILIDNKRFEAACLEARNIANYVADVVMEAATIKQKYPYANYERVLYLPQDIAGRSYYIEITDKKVYVNSTDGAVSVNSTNYNLEELCLGVNGRAFGGKVKIYCNKSRYVYKFDFGTPDSPLEPDYTRITNISSNDNWALDDWKYRTRISIYNPSQTEPLPGNFQIMIILTKENFDYSHVKDDGSDIRFWDNGNLDYWIERWNPNGISVIWVKIPPLPLHTYSVDTNSTRYIYMYYGNPNAVSLSNGSRTFDFFDDFSGNTIDTNKWDVYNNPNVEVKDGYLILWGEASIVTKDAHIQDGVIETKAGVSGLSPLESSLFARCENKIAPYYSHAYYFSSGNFTDQTKNLAIWKGNILLANDSLNTPQEDEIWHRLQLSLDGNTIVACRYVYWDSSYQNGTFGLCRTVESSSATYFDWILVRKVTNPLPVINILGEDCRDYGWRDCSDLESKDRGKPTFLNRDVVCSNKSDATFSMDVDNGIYSVTLTLGDQNRSCDGICIYAEDELKLSDIYCDKGKFVKRWFTVNVTDGRLDIKFNDTEGDYYWAVTSMVIEIEEG